MFLNKCDILQITAIGRYGMSPTKCKIPIGTFYGHSYVLASDGYAENNSYFRPNSDLNVQVSWKIRFKELNKIHFTNRIVEFVRRCYAE